MCKFKTSFLIGFITQSLFFINTINADYLINPYICGEPTCNPSSKLQYQVSVIYKYEYNTTVNTWFSGASDNVTTLNIRTKLSVEFLKPCEGLLKILSAEFDDNDDEFLEDRVKTFDEELKAYPLRFAFHSGIITEVCAQDGEQDWTLNFKRGVLSLFQNSMNRLDIDHRGIESDIHGTCNTEYRMKGQMNTSLIIVKKKDLSHCDNRYKYLSILQTVRYNFNSKFQTWPVLQSESRCRIEIDHSVYTNVVCRERHMFEPFSGNKTGAMTTVFQTMSIYEEVNKTNSEIMDEKGEEWEAIKHRGQLLHHHISISRLGIGELRSSREFLKQLCKVEEAIADMDNQEIPESSGNEFTTGQEAHGGEIVSLWGGFVRACRTLNHPALSQLLNRAGSICPEAKKHVIDALPYIASTGSVELIKDMIKQGSVNSDTTKEWLMSLAMIPRPQREMIDSMKELLEKFPGDKFVFLAASSMVHSYCRNSGKTLSECCEEKQNMDVIKIFQNNVEIDNLLEKNITRALKEKASVSIKSLGNIGCFANAPDYKFADKLMEMIENPNVPLQLRLHIIDAFRKTPCHETREYFLELFRKQSLDVEIRIASYLQVMRCPKYVSIKAIVQILENERINQVASFVWSHLQNLGKSTIPSRVEKQGMLSGNFIPDTKEQPDFRKFSRNYEHGLFFDQYNAGGNYEANLIMSPDSYIPRSASLNLTVDMFGESINILEINLRNEGFEKFIEDIFTKSGPLSRSKIDEKIKMLRFRRSTDEADAVNEKVNNINFENEAADHRNPILDMGIKVFGNEISYWNAEGDSEIMDAVSKLNPLYHINNILSGKEISYKKSSLFLDTTYSVPTGCGLPLTMNLMGTSVVNLKISGSISGTANFFETKTLHFKGKMHPSMALNVAATMNVVGGGLGSTGIRLNTRLHTSTAFSTDLDLQSGNVVQFKVSIPHTKQEIFQASSELLLLRGIREIKQESENKNKIEASTCSWRTLDYAVGIKLCATYEFPNVTEQTDPPYFVMAGPAKYLLSLEKVDPSAKVYSFLFSWHSNETTKLVDFSFDTPGSKTKRMFNSSVSIAPDSASAALVFQSSHNYLKAYAKYKNQPYNKLIECVLDIDGQKHFDAVLSLTKQDQKNGFVWIPRMHVAVNNEKITELVGYLKMVQKKGVSQCDVSLQFQTKKLASRLIGYIIWNGPSKGAKLKLDYQFLDQRKQSVKLDGLISSREVGQRKDFYGELGLEFTSYPHLNFFTTAKYMATLNHMECNMNLSSSRETIMDNPKFHYSMASHRTQEGRKLYHHLKLVKPYLDLYFKYDVDGSLKTMNTTFIYDKPSNPGSLIAVTGKLYLPPGIRLYMDAGLNVTLPSMTPMVCDLRLHEKSANDYHISLQGVWFTGTDVTIVALYQDQSTPQISSRRLKAVVSGSSFREIAVDTKYTQDNKQTNLNARAEQEDDRYSITGRYVIHSEKNKSVYGQVDWKAKTYSVSLYLHNESSLVADIHLDQIRDIHLALSKINTPEVKRISADINWDSNRDPNQKVSFVADFLNKDTLNYGGSFMLFYPGRLINGHFDFLLKDWLCKWHVNVGWSPDDVIYWRVKFLSESEKETMYALYSEMDTPFQGWRDTSLNLIWRYVDNLQALSGNMTWEKERLVFNLSGNYMLKTNEVFGELVALVNSTIASLPKVSAIAKHHHLWRKSSDTLLSFEYSESGVMMLDSSWKIDRNPATYNITGKVGLKSPFEGYKTGHLATKFVFNQKRDVQGVTHLTVEDKIYTISIDGHIRRITNSMIIFNVTSPSPTTIILLSGRLGFVDTDRHIVAMIETPNIIIGAEALLRLQSFSDFHIFGHIALPIDHLRDTMGVAKITNEEIDFRIGLEKHIAGFTGIWHYNNLFDFQYLYKIFTPIKGFEENGLVLKNLYKGNDLDAEVSLRLSKMKLGIAFAVRDNGVGILKLIEKSYHNRIKIMTVDKIFENFSSDLHAVVDTLIYPTVTFNAQLNKFDNYDDFEEILISAQLQLPNMTAITLKSKVIIEDLATMSHDMHIITPFKSCQEIKFYQSVEVIVEEKYNSSMILLVKNNTVWNENSLKLLYLHEVGDDEAYSTRTGKINLISQFETFKRLNADVQIHVDASLTRLNANIDTPSCQLGAKGKVEMDDVFVDINGEMNLQSPYVKPYDVKLDFKKDFSDVENTIVFGLKVKQGDQNNYLSSELSWRTAITDQLRAKVSISLTPVIPPSEMVFALSQTETYSVVKGEGRIGGKENIYTLLAEQKPGATTVSLTTPFRGFRNMKLILDIKNNETITGTFQKDLKTYDITGKISSLSPLDLLATLKPVDGGDTYQVKLKTVEVANKLGLSASLMGAIQFTLYVNFLKGDGFKEFSAKVDCSHNYIKEIFIKSRTELTDDKRVLFSIQAQTPFNNLKTIQADADLSLTPRIGAMICQYNLTNLIGENNIKWSFIPDDVYFKIMSYQTTTNETRSLDINTFHFNNRSSEKPLIDFATVGFHIDLDNAWKCGSNVTLTNFDNKNINVSLNALLPKPNLDVHSLDVHYNNENSSTKEVDILYTTDESQKLLSINGKVLPSADDLLGNLTIKWGEKDKIETVDNLMKFYMLGNLMKLDYKLLTPYYSDEYTLKLDGTFDKNEDHTMVIGNLCYPESSKLFDIDLNYGGMKHTVCDVNTTTPFKPFPWLRTKAFLSNEEKFNENIVQVFWSNQSALLNSTHKLNKVDEDTKAHHGVLLLEIPFNTSHVFKSDYTYNEGKNWKNGTNVVYYNDDQFINGQFTSETDIGEQDLQRDTTDANIEIKSYPSFGVHYVHQYDEEGTHDIKQASVFKINKTLDFNLTGRFEIEPWNSGKQVKIMVIQGNKTVRFENNYESVDNEFFQGSKLQWAPNIWLHYDLNILNKTNNDEESQEVKVSVKYPKRSFSVAADYHMRDTLLQGAADIHWTLDEDNQTVRVEGKWFNPESQNSTLHDVKLSLMHPSFSKDITLLGKYTSDITMTSDIAISLDYSDYPEDKLTFHSTLSDNSNGPVRDYKFELDCKHPATNLDLVIRTDLNMKYKHYHLRNYYNYQKSLFHQTVKYGELLVDWNNRNIKYQHQKDKNWYNMNASFVTLPSEYKMFVKVNRTNGQDDGIWILSTKDKSMIAHFNRSNDISYHLIGLVKDVRTAELNAWRDFIPEGSSAELITVKDVSSYIRLNHSRLLTSQILWRPEIPQEAKAKMSSTLREVYSQITDILSIWKGIPVETLDVMKNVWAEAKPKLREFLNDLNDLHIIKDDLDEFHQFLTESYEANEFYAKDIIEFILDIIDQLALRNQIENLPKIVNEIWQVMGETGKSFREGLQWILDEIKSSHSSLMEKINSILETDIMEQVSKVLESGIMKYDSFMKSLHVQFIHYLETTWKNITVQLTIFWRSVLKSLEPTYLKIAHYAETFVWKLGKEVMNFFNEKSNEIIDSPYFHMFSSLVQNIYDFWEDINKNDAVTNIKKYSKIAMKFVNDKILVHVPFRKELQDLVTEIIEELNKLQELSLVKYIKLKLYEAKSRLEWWYEYFMIGDTIDAICYTIYRKIMEGAKTALQNEEEHRVAKTNFIFDPRKGQLLLEQKLPFPWFAFNRTPDISEIPEYKAFVSVMDSVILSNKSLMTYYYEIMPYMDIYNLLPPFYGVGVMTAMGTIITMDKKVFTLSDQGMFLLSRDFLEKNFTLLIESNTPQKYNLVILTSNSLIRLDLFDEKITKDGSQMISLPTRIDECIIERDEVVIKITHDHGVYIECDYHFKTCTFRFDGWYYGRLGGLFGTMNNEPYDDMFKTSREETKSVSELANSWKIMDSRNLETSNQNMTFNNKICVEYFDNKVSPLKSCFPLIPVSPFYDQCTLGLDPCTLANAYMKICMSQHIPIRTPEKCMECTAPGGKILEEGMITSIDSVSNSTDVVFIVETHSCNNNIRKNKNIDQFVSILDAKLEESGLTNNRYAVVGYGKPGKYSSAYYIYHNNKLFTSAGELPAVLDQLQFESEEISNSGNYSSDAFHALSLASTITFRPGVSKTFFLFPCTKCVDYALQLDYSVVHQVLMDSSVTLHIIMNGEFSMNKKRVAKVLYGIDSEFAYTVKDTRELMGDSELRQQVKMPKAQLGFCLSLAMETNGTIFSGNKLKHTEPQGGRRAATVLSTRVSRTSRPCSRARCECHSSALRCTACPRHIPRNHMGDIAMGMWDSEEMDDFIDNFLDISIPI